MSNFKLDTKTLFLTIPQISNEMTKEIAYNRILEKYNSKLSCFIVSLENHKEQGQHLHIYIEFNKRFQSKLPDVFDFIADKHPNIQSARKKLDVIKYIIKDGDYMSYKITPSDYIKEAKEHTVRQSKGDFYELAELIKDTKYSLKELNEQYPHLFLKYGEHIQKYIRFIKDIKNNEKTDKYYKELYENVEWSKFQRYLLDLVNSPVDSRKINWIYDKQGNKGKSFIANYMRLFKDAYIITGGKSADIYRHYDNNSIVIYDLPRDYMNENISLYSTMECFKNGYILDTKFEGQKKSFIPPHIIVLSNNLPDINKMSKDRWNIIDLETDLIESVGQPITDEYELVDEEHIKEEQNYNEEVIEEIEQINKDFQEQQKEDIQKLRAIISFTDGMLYLNRYRYSEKYDRFYDKELIEYIRL